ncbi:MAG: hypothetical protein NUV59_00660 [Patescibacteria group bacterium]|nr:hypothetical protein [Patescibacteria group bacterium]
MPKRGYKTVEIFSRPIKDADMVIIRTVTGAPRLRFLRTYSEYGYHYLADLFRMERQDQELILEALRSGGERVEVYGTEERPYIVGFFKETPHDLSGEFCKDIKFLSERAWENVNVRLTAWQRFRPGYFLMLLGLACFLIWYLGGHATFFALGAGFLAFSFVSRHIERWSLRASVLEAIRGDERYNAALATE